MKYSARGFHICETICTSFANMRPSNYCLTDSGLTSDCLAGREDFVIHSQWIWPLPYHAAASFNCSQQNTLCFSTINAGPFLQALPILPCIAELTHRHCVPDSTAEAISMSPNDSARTWKRMALLVTWCPGSSVNSREAITFRLLANSLPPARHRFSQIATSLHMRRSAWHLPATTCLFLYLYLVQITISFATSIPITLLGSLLTTKRKVYTQSSLGLS